MLKEKILELVNRPNRCKVIFEHESYGVYFCICYIDDGRIMYKGSGKDDETAFEIANRNRLRFRQLSISLDKYDFKQYPRVEVINTKGFRIALLLDKDLKRKIIREIDIIDEDEFIVWDQPQPLENFCIDNHIELIESVDNISLYRYTTKMCGPLCGSGGFIKIDRFTQNVIASKMEWIS